jgi:hypothetical protein
VKSVFSFVDESYPQKTWMVLSMHGEGVVKASGAWWMYGGCAVKMSGVWLIREVSSLASDGLCDCDVRKSGLAIRAGGQSGSG